MNLEIHKPEPVQRVNAQIQSRQLHNADELIEQALEALDEKAPAPASAAERRRAAGRKSLVEVFAPLRGLNLDFSRNKSTGRSVTPQRLVTAPLQSRLGRLDYVVEKA
jgi:hypothetical protein